MTFAAPALGAAGLISNLAGGFAGAQGKLQTGRANSMASYYQAAVAANNAALANQAAGRATAAGIAKTQDVGLKGAANLGSIKTEQAANGVDVNSGSALNVQSSARRENQISTERTMQNAEEQAWGYRVQASNEMAQAALDAQSGKNIEQGAQTGATAQEAGALGTALLGVPGTGLLGAAQALSSKWQNIAG